MSSIAVALFLFLFSIYLLTASGHTYSPDEESLLYVAQSFVTRGDFTIPSPNQYPVVGGHRGVGGKIYAGTGLAQSLLAVPFYVVANIVARAFDPRFHDFILRLFIVSIFNSIISAASSIVLFAWMRRLGFSLRVALALVLVCALATMAWIYARTFYSEPLLTLWFLIACYSARAFYDTRATRWMLAAGFATGLALLTKVQGVLVLPALGIYFVGLGLTAEGASREAPQRSRAACCVFCRRVWGIRGRTRRDVPSRDSAVKPGLVFLGALAVGALFFMYYNFIRFGDPFQTGRGEISQSFPILTGLYGLLLSPGKSVFLYAPPIILFFVALPRFFKEQLAETLLCIILIATFVVFHARFEMWSGDGAWGPRYLVPTMPFWILPIGASVGKWWRGVAWRLLVAMLIGAGLVVNLLALTINFDTYLQLQPRANSRYFDPPASPLLAQWNLLQARVGDWWSELITAQDAVVPLRGFLATGDERIFPRYLAPRATLLVKSELEQPLHMSLLANDYRPEQEEKRRLTFFGNGVALESQLLPTGDSGVLNYRVQIPVNLAHRALIDVMTLGSESVGKSPMGDELGVHLQSLQVNANQQTLTLSKYLAIPPLPTADPKMMWAWFYQPTHAQFDSYWWYLYFTGLGDAQVFAVIAIFNVVGILALVLSAPTLARAWRESRSMLSSPQPIPVMDAA